MERDPELSQSVESEPSPATLIAWEVRGNMLLFLNSDPSSEQAVAAQTKINDGFESLVRLTESEVTNSVKKYIHGSKDDVAEIVQETYIRAYKSLPNFRSDGPIEAWLGAIARNQTKSHNTKRGKQLKRQTKNHAEKYEEDFLDTLPAEGEDQDPYWWVENEIQRKALVAALDELAPRFSESVIAHYVYGDTLGEIAEREGVTENYAKQIVFRAIRRLRRNKGLQQHKKEQE